MHLFDVLQLIAPFGAYQIHPVDVLQISAHLQLSRLQHRSERGDKVAKRATIGIDRVGGERVGLQ